jgi:1-aminocyclopropane-1-carboxylate deaminase/D-cysteine desulfhydrase-like pyridoxal-dependent ACC family enzyme
VHARLDRLPRLRLAALPTPLVEAARLTRALGGPQILFKRDDLTGLALGGNKIREFEYSLAPAVDNGHDVLLNSASSQSNQSCQTAAVACRLGMRSVIVARRDEHASPLQGNLLLCRLFGAEVHLVEADRQTQAKEEIIADLRARGHRPYDTGYDGAVLRSVAYVDGFVELWQQLQAAAIEPTALYLCSGDHAHVGLALAARALGTRVRIVGVPYSTRRSDAQNARRLAGRAREAAEALGLSVQVEERDMETHVRHAGRGYGIPTPATEEAMTLVARTEGLVLDPVYTGKAMAGLIAHIREGRLTAGDTVVFLHTGGAPGLFAYNRDLQLLKP